MRRFGLAFSEQPFPTGNGVDKGTNAFFFSWVPEFRTEANFNKCPRSVSAAHQPHHLGVPGTTSPWPEDIYHLFLALF